MNITNHAVERYAQRIQGHDVVSSDISAADAANIRNILEGYINPSDLLYKDMPFTDRDGRDTNTDIYLHDDIVLIYNSETDTIITVYKIDLGFDDGMNQRYIKAIRSKIEALEKIRDLNIANIQNIIENYDQYISDYNESIIEAEKRIDEYKRTVKQYEKQKEQCLEDVTNIKEAAKAEIQQLVGTMIQKK